VTTEQQQAGVDQANADFWAELCGSHLARAVGVTDRTSASLARYDEAYMDLFPYLDQFLPWRSGERLLEIGTGYGTVGQLLAERRLDYHALDISAGPVGMMIHRLEMLGLADPGGRVIQGTALDIPHPDESFDVVVSIGCLHHTGDMAGAIREVHRVLRPGGQTMLMLYNRNSYRRRLVLPMQMLRTGAWRSRQAQAEVVRRAYDASADGTAAPATEFASVRDVHRLLTGFSEIRVNRENWGEFLLTMFGKHLFIPRRAFLPNVARIAGLDLYITAVKSAG
jgi:ubiquinone/menaquinone biosynthesis C-methylase UbiE